jgi:hypothetical protein
MGLLVVFLYIIVGSSLVFTDFMDHLIEGQLRTVIGVVCILYGAFRGVRYYFNNQDHSEP